eukprot:jgi/Picre1/27685/NNA_000649.t1
MTWRTALASASHGGNCVREPEHDEEEHSELLGEEEHEDHEDHEHEDDSYNLDLAIASVFVVWFVSFLGAGFPLLLAIKRHPWVVMAIKFGSFAGSGVMLATGFVHMLFAANENLSSNFLQTIDYILFLFLYPVTRADGTEERFSLGQGEAAPLPGAGLEGAALDGRSDGGMVNGLVPSQYRDDSLDVMEKSDSDSGAECNKHVRCKDDDCNSRVLLHSTMPKGKLLSNIIVSEVSICVHSVIIGVTLGTTSSSEFVALFVAIIFHQLLEGVALGSTASDSGLGSKIVLIFAAIYSVTTPIGIAIGIGVRQSLDTSSPGFLYTTGVLDSIAAGALIFLALGDHMNSIRTQAKWMRQSSVYIQLACFGFFYTELQSCWCWQFGLERLIDLHSFTLCFVACCRCKNDYAKNV